MGRSLLFAAAVLALVGSAATPARADVEGPVCVTDGDEIAVNGKRSHQRCVGGTTVRLFGIVAPDLEQMCPVGDGREWQCGRASAAMLLEAVMSRTVTCRGTSKDREDRLMAVCFVDGTDINQKMVRDGWALAYSKHSTKYADDEEAAVGARRGLWRVSANVYFGWRNR